MLEEAAKSRSKIPAQALAILLRQFLKPIQHLGKTAPANLIVPMLRRPIYCQNQADHISWRHWDIRRYFLAIILRTATGDPPVLTDQSADLR